MATSLSALIEVARTKSLDPHGQMVLHKQLKSVAAYTTPDLDDVRQALSLGDATAVDLLLTSPRLDPSQRQDLATNALHVWAKEPLSFNLRAPFLDILLSAGANAHASDRQGRTPNDRLVERLDHLLVQEKSRSYESGPTTRLRQWVATLSPRQGTRIQATARVSSVNATPPPKPR